MPNEEPIKASEQYLKDKFGKFVPLEIFVCKTGKLTSTEVQNPCSHPQVVIEHPFSILGIWWLGFRVTSITKSKKFAKKNVMF